MKKNQYCNALKVLNIVKYLLSIILFILVISFAIVGHCATGVGLQFPIVVDNIDVTPYQTYINNTYGGFWNLSQDNVIGWGSQENGYYVQSFAVPQVQGQISQYLTFSPSNLVGSYPDFDYHNNTLTLTFSNLANDNYKPWRIMHFYSNGTGPNYPYSTAFNNANTLSKGVYGNTGATLNYVSSNIYLTNQGEFVVNMPIFVNEIPIVPIEPDDTAPVGMEKPQIDDYIPEWTNTPTFDNSSVENALQSVYNGIVWFGNNIKGTITGSIQYVADTIRWAIQKILDTLRSLIGAVQNTINDIKNGILTVVDKIQGFFDYVSQPYDSTKVNTAFNNMTIKADYNNLTTLVNNAFSVFDSTAEPNTFQIPIHLERIPILHVQTVQYIDLGWLYDCREGIRIFMWCITTFGLLYTIIDSLPSYLSGNDE